MRENLEAAAAGGDPRCTVHAGRGQIRSGVTTQIITMTRVSSLSRVTLPDCHASNKVILAGEA